MNQRRRTVKLPADLLGVDSTSIQEYFFQQRPVPQLSPLYQQEEDNEEQHDFILNCHTPNSRCSTISMDIFSMDGDVFSVSEEEESRQPTSLVRANQHRSDTNNIIEKRLALPVDEENDTYITMTSSSSYSEDFKDAAQSARCNTPYTYKTMDSKEISCEDKIELHGGNTPYTYKTIDSEEIPCEVTIELHGSNTPYTYKTIDSKEISCEDTIEFHGSNTPYTYKTIDSKEISCEDTIDLHGDPNLCHSMHTRHTYRTMQSHEATTPNCIGKKKKKYTISMDESTPYEVKSADNIGHLNECVSPIMQSLDCFSIDLYNSYTDMSENHFSIDSYSSSSDGSACKHSSIERARCRRDQAFCKLQRLEKKLLGEHDTSTPEVLSLREDGCGLSQRLVQMEKQRQRLSHAVHTYCHHTKTEP
jgi:hypothetical protein